MGADIKVEGNMAVINGVENFMGAAISAPDLRAGAALVLAGLVAEGFTIIDQIEYIERGYEDLEGKFVSLGAGMEKLDVNDERAIKKFKLRVS